MTFTELKSIIHIAWICFLAAGILMAVARYAENLRAILGAPFGIIASPFSFLRERFALYNATIVRWIKGQMEVEGDPRHILTYICGTIVVSALGIVMICGEIGNLLYTLPTLGMKIPDEYLFSSAEAITAVSLISLVIFSFIAFFDVAGMTNSIAWISVMPVRARKVFTCVTAIMCVLLLILQASLGIYRGKSMEFAEKAMAVEDQAFSQQLETLLIDDNNIEAQILSDLDTATETGIPPHTKKIMDNIRTLILGIVSLLMCLGAALCLNSMFHAFKMVILAITIITIVLPVALMLGIISLFETILNSIYGFVLLVFDCVVRIGNDLCRLILRREADSSSNKTGNTVGSAEAQHHESLEETAEEVFVSDISFDPYGSNKKGVSHE